MSEIRAGSPMAETPNILVQRAIGLGLIKDLCKYLYKLSAATLSKHFQRLDACAGPINLSLYVFI